MYVAVMSNDIYLQQGLSVLFHRNASFKGQRHIIDVDCSGGTPAVIRYLREQVGENDMVTALSRHGVHSRQFNTLGSISISTPMVCWPKIITQPHRWSTRDQWIARAEYLLSQKGITERQSSIIRLYERGWPSHAIAKYLGMSIKTLHSHMRKVFSLYQVRNQAELQKQLREYKSDI